jgi:hypothetical protein
MGGTSDGSFYLVEDDVLVAIPNEGYVQTEEGARTALAESDRIAREMGRQHVLIVLIDPVRSQDARGRRVWTVEADPRLRCGVALVCRSMLARAMGSFFMGLNKPVIETRMFAGFDDALGWARQRVKDHGGPIGG